jgi:UDP-2,3-diacylglucosamine pyrophosphatase LpxH
MAPYAPARRCRSVFLSDLHLGAPTARADALLDFLEGLEPERVYLLGDVVDGWRLSRRWFWPPAHAAVLDRLLDFARRGAEVVYVPGNHDAFARAWSGLSGAGIQVEREAIHVAADGRRYLLTHGDFYDPKAGASRVSKAAGDIVYRALMRLDRGWRWTQRQRRRPQTSLAAWAKARSVLAREVVATFEAALAAEAGRRGFDGVICGHIHSAATRDVEGVAYVNCGDWVESCSAVVEALSGVMEVVRWSPPLVAKAPPRAAPAGAPAPVWGT